MKGRSVYVFFVVEYPVRDVDLSSSIVEAWMEIQLVFAVQTARSYGVLCSETMYAVSASPGSSIPPRGMKFLAWIPRLGRTLHLQVHFLLSQLSCRS